MSPVSPCWFPQVKPRPSSENKSEPSPFIQRCCGRSWVDRRKQNTDVPAAFVYNKPQSPPRWHKVQNKRHKPSRNSSAARWLRRLDWSKLCETNAERQHDFWRSILSSCLTVKQTFSPLHPSGTTSRYRATEFDLRIDLSGWFSSSSLRENHVETRKPIPFLVMRAILII